MFDPRPIRCLLAICAVAAPLAATAATRTPPTPPPCSADGYCQPDGRQWGYTQQKWRRWPGSDAIGKQPGAGEIGPQLPGVDPPRKEAEDRTAPPPVESILPQPRRLDEEIDETDDEFAPARPGEPPRPPRDPADRFGPPEVDDRPEFLRDPNRATPPLGQPGLGQPGLGQPGLGQPPVGQPPLGQPPVGPRSPALDDASRAPAGGTSPDSNFFPNFNTQANNDDAPPTLPFMGQTQLGQGAPATASQGMRGPAPIVIPQPTADRTTSVPRQRASQAVATSERSDRAVRPASFGQDAPPSLPPTFLQ